MPSVIWLRRIALGLVLTWALGSAPARAASASTEAGAKPRGDGAAERLRKALDQPMDLDLAEQPLHLALNQLREQARINLVLDRVGLQAMGLDPEQLPVTAKLQ